MKECNMNDTRKETQRWPHLDVVELIANLIASYSHLFELYNSENVELDKYVEYPSVMDDEQAHSLQEGIIKKEELIEKVYSLRKLAMSVLKDLSPEYNKKIHCLLKHAIASYEYAQELWDTDRTNLKYQELALDCTQYMYFILSMYMWVEPSLCWRCLQDALEDI